ncbi:MAG: priA [Dehalococcoidia bacterium]|nr:priA [Dehalococcoidia bacterium]
MGTPEYAEIAVNAPTPQRGAFSYSIPKGMSLSPGQAVWVPFGSRLLQGIVFDLTNEPQVMETRDIVGVIGDSPILWPWQLEFARWISDYYIAPLFDCASTMMPPSWEQRVLTIVMPRDNPSASAEASLNSRQRELLGHIRRKGRVDLEEMKTELKEARAGVIVDLLLRRGLVEKATAIASPRVRPKLERIVSLVLGTTPPPPLRGQRQSALLEILRSHGPVIAMSELNRRLGPSGPTVKSLERLGLVEVREIRVVRDPLAHQVYSPVTPPQLTSDQEAAYKSIEKSLLYWCQGGRSSTSDSTPPQSFLLHGVTGSGKTEVYLRALAQAVALGKSGIVLVPEISLTPQTVQRFYSRFPSRVALLHSGLSMGELFDEWWRIREGEFHVAIGSRSALFAPQPNLGLIVIDEEHEGTYKQQEPSPRYHAREAALKLAELTGAVVVLGSATPDLGTYTRSLDGELRILELPQRISIAQNGDNPTATPSGETYSSLPQCTVVDLRQELKDGNRSIFSRALRAATERALAQGEQIILFINRRGNATFVQCRDCGYVARCRRCDTPLTYHSASEELICHTCNNRRPAPEVCPTCDSLRIRFLGVGTERVVAEAVKEFPEARVLRWDRDVTRGRRSHEKVLEEFLSHRADILVGTQMIAKGLDIPLVTLVGVVNADVNLHIPDFRAAERTFQLLTQVAGRAGRGHQEGQVILQTYNPEHYSIAAAARQDYTEFYHREMRFRGEHRFPPYSSIIRLLFSHTNLQRAQQEADRLYVLLDERRRAAGLADLSIIGPAPPYITRIRGRYRWQIVLMGQEARSLLSEVRVPSGWIIDVDPVSLL